MNEFKILMIFMISVGAIQTTYAQENESSRELKISDEEKIILFSGFSIAVIGIFVFYYSYKGAKKRGTLINMGE